MSDALNSKYEELIEIVTIEEKIEADDSMVELLDMVCMILLVVVFVMSIAFSAVVISMLCSKSFVKERMDIGILKSLGFTSSGLRVQFALRFMIIAVIGSVIGAVASMFLTMPLLEALLRILGLTRIDTSITFTTFIIPAAAIWLSFFVFAYIAARKIKKVEIRELIESEEYTKAEGKLCFAVGKDIGGKCIVGNIAKLPHMLIAGTTGSGKSVCINTLIMSLLYKATPEEVLQKLDKNAELASMLQFMVKSMPGGYF